MKCVECQCETLERTTVEDEIRVGSRVFTVTVPASRCTQCGEAYIDGLDVERAELEVVMALANAGEVDGEAFKFARKALGFTAVELGVELGVASKTISRWETGEGEVDRLAWLALAAMAADAIAGTTLTQDRLRAVRERPGLAKAVRLALPPPRELAGE